VAAGDVGSHGHADEEGERMGDRDRHQASRVQRATVGQFPCVRKTNFQSK
jgi:hypothetical protein